MAWRYSLPRPMPWRPRQPLALARCVVAILQYQREIGFYALFVLTFYAMLVIVWGNG
jgi:hypothetical protein